ncbi:hypothetical protein RRG08_000053 [Elysia crispata]|uniref:Uncharacterized protein n=1 Tax=Elysia crispata TaxID=231223 RepID=A0AAE0Y5W9_9GAST|nr:hypothetical protein RRG08_000053 [Elysia crispata]
MEIKRTGELYMQYGDRKNGRNTEKPKLKIRALSNVRYDVIISQVKSRQKARHLGPERVTGFRNVTVTIVQRLGNRIRARKITPVFEHGSSA